jgi:putative flippase GtrA
VFWVHHGLHPIDANIVAFLLAAQMNFVLSDRFTWHDRGPALSLPTRWLFFHASIALMAVVNLTVFTVAQTAVPYLVASVLGIGVAAIGNFFSGDWLVFRTPSPTLGLRPLADDADRSA